jgi:nucleotide-binding universal stress UspA family protein
MDMQSDRPSGIPAPRGDGPQQRHLIVGVDGSPGSRVALLHALAEAARRGTGLDVVSAHPTTLPWTGGSPIDVPNAYEVLREAQARTRSFVEDIRSDPAIEAIPGASAVPVRIIPVAGAAAEALVDRSADAELLVVGSRGRSAVRSALLGSVALHCVTHAACPVVVVHPRPAGTPAGAPVVVGVDGSAESLAALRAAVAEAARLHTDVVVAAAYLPGYYWMDMYSIATPSAAEIRGRVLERTDEMVAQVLAERGSAPDGRQPAVVVEPVEGAAEDVLVERARDAALLVVGSRGRGTMRGLLLGSIALHCAMHASCPVLVVHPRRVRAPADVAPRPSAVAHG